MDDVEGIGQAEAADVVIEQGSDARVDLRARRLETHERGLEVPEAEKRGACERIPAKR